MQADPIDDASVQRRTIERMKELDLAHRNRLRGAAGLTLSLRFLSAALRRLRMGTAPARCEPVPRPTGGALAVTFVGHSTVMLTTARTRVLTDPLLGNWVLGLRRAKAAGIAAGDLAEIRLVLISHAHHDHLRRPSLRRLPRTATVIVPPRCADLVSDLGFSRVIELGVGTDFGFEDLQVVAVPARHEGVRGPYDLARRGAVGYVVKTPEATAYFAGDTAYFSGFAEIGQRFHPDVALLPIAGYEPAGFREANMSPLDAAYAFEDLAAAILIPIGHGSFQLSYEPLEAPLAWLREVAVERKMEDKLAILDHGETRIVERPA